MSDRKPRAAIYARYSTDKQDRKTSIEAQIENCTIIANKEGFRIVRVLQDHALSGAKIDRPGYKALKQTIRDKQIDIVMADELSRLSRVTSETVALGEILKQQRPKMHLVTCDGIDTRTDGWEWLLLIKAGVASQERRNIANRTYSRLRQRHRDGKSAGGKPYGYDHEQDGDYRIKVVVPEQAKIVRRIFEMYAEGMTHRQIARALNAEGIPSPGSTWARTHDGENRKRRDGSWVGSGIYSMLRNPIYRGEVIWNRHEYYDYTDPDSGRTTRKRAKRPEDQWERHQDESLRIVPKKLWARCEARMQETSQRVQEQRQQNKDKKGGYGGRRRQRLFDLRCAECGGSFTMIDGYRLACNSWRGGGNCSNDVRLKLRYVNRTIIDALCNRKDGLLAEPTVAAVRKHMARHVQKLKREAARESGTARELRHRIAEVDRKIENVLDLAETEGPSPEVKRRLSKLRKDREGLEHRLAATGAGELDRLPDVIPNAIRTYREQIERLADVKHGLSAQEVLKVRALMSEIMEPPLVGPDGAAQLQFTQSLVAGAGFEPATFGL